MAETPAKNPVDPGTINASIQPQIGQTRLTETTIGAKHNGVKMVTQPGSIPGTVQRNTIHNRFTIHNGRMQ
jgi:hypothetical protein